MEEVGSIKRLSEEVVNRIAAGEVIQRPANAVKEMLENSLDAKSSSIVITLKEGGLKFLQIQDNGTGIKKCDMDIVCERFTTSKLSKFEDLTNIDTYGFRGEALASITHVAHVTIMSKTQDSMCAYKCSYRDGKVLGAIKPCASNNGTQITVEDLFYNVPMRRHALKSSLEEHRRVVDVATRYAVHNPATEFTVRKQNDTNPDVKTLARSSKLDNIRLLYGSSLAREMIELKGEDKRLGFKMHGWISNANYSSKKHTFILFINNRSVDNSDLRRVLEASYAAYLPKNSYPFIYLSLEIDPKNVDVNVHPTKSEVHFLNEGEVVDEVQKQLDACLLSCNHSRTFFTQTLLPVEIKGDGSSAGDEGKDRSEVVRDNTLVRTDSKARKIDSFLLREVHDDGGGGGGCCQSGGHHNHDENNNSDNNITNNVFERGDLDSSLQITELKGPSTASVPLKTERQSLETAFKNSPSAASSSSGSLSSSSSSSLVTAKRKISLTSVASLKKEIEANVNIGLKELLNDSSWVGVVDEKWWLLQHSTKLHLANSQLLLKEFFYQLFVLNFGNFGVIKLSEAASIYDLCLLALEHPSSGWKASDGPMHDLASFVSGLLASKAAMLWDYFSIRIDQQGNLLSLPLLIQNFVPSLSQLPHFILRISTEVDWEQEKGCFKGLCKELSSFYATPAQPPQSQGAEDCLGGGVEGRVNDGVRCDTEADSEDSVLRKQMLGDDEDESKKEDDVGGVLEVDKDKMAHKTENYNGAGNDKENKTENGENKTGSGENKTGSGENKTGRGENKDNDDGDEDNENEWRKYVWNVEHVLFPSLKRHLLPSKNLSQCLLQVANLPDLYKVFERC